MSFKKSAVTVNKNKEVWTRNLVKFQHSIRKRGKIGLLHDSLASLSRLPKENMIIGRYKALSEKVRSRTNRIKSISEEIKLLWNKLNFPILSPQAVLRKIERVINKFDTFLKKPTGSIESVFCVLFDVTKTDGVWLCHEDQRLYKSQIDTNGEIGYTTTKLASVNSIHPSKRRKISQVILSSSSPTQDVHSSNSSNFAGEPDDQFSSTESSISQSTTNSVIKPRQSTSSAVNLVRQAKLSTRRAFHVCQSLHNDGIHLSTPSQSGIYKAVYREAEKLKLNLKENLKNDSWCLHFDGKILNNKEHQVVVLKNEFKEVRLSILALPNGQAKTIASAIAEVLTEFSLWSSIKMIVSDTTNVNTGKKNGVVVSLQKWCREFGFESPVFIGCQHHILDRILRLVLDEIVGGQTRSPNINYPFVLQIIDDYDSLKENFLNNEAFDDSDMITEEEQGWRDDMKFLFHLTRVFRHYKRHGKMPKVTFRALPGLTNARWNSRAIFTLLSYILIPDSRTQLGEACNFISYSWSDAWFSCQFFDENHYSQLQQALHPYSKAARCLETHWSQLPSPINTQRSNICAERAIKILEDIYPLCRQLIY
jgi:hypothetical protein